MTSFLDIDTSNAKEPEVLDGGQEVKLRIVGFRTNDEDSSIMTNKNGDDYFSPIYEILDHPYAKTISDYMEIPTESMDEKKRNRNALKIQRWKKCFDLPEGGFNLEEQVGKEGWVILGKRTNDFSGEEENTIRKFNI